MPQRVLVVDDEEAVRDLLEEFLQDQGFQVCAAADGVEGIEVFGATSPDLVLIDFLLPKKNGFAVADAIRRSARPDVPIIMMSGVFKNPKTAVEAEEKYQVVEFLTKPLDLPGLATKIRAVLSAHSAREQSVVDLTAGSAPPRLESGETMNDAKPRRRLPSFNVGRWYDKDPSASVNGDASAIGEIVDGVYRGRPFPDMIESGPLETWPVALLLSTVRYDRATGMLDMNNDAGTHRRIYVIDGNPTFMQSNAAGENVGALLLSRGRITEPDFDRCLRYMKDEGRTLQQSLLELRLVTEAGLATAYKLLAGRLLPLALGMSFGQFRWRMSDAFVGRVPQGRFEPIQVLFDGIKRHVHPPQILRFFKGREDVPLVPTTEFDALIPFLRQTFGHATAAEEIDGHKTYRQLSRAHGADVAKVVPQLFALVTSGMAILPETTDDNALEAAVNAAAMDELSAEPLDRHVHPSGFGGASVDAQAQAAVQRYHAEIMSKDFFQIFGATSRTADDEIKAAYFELARRWHADAFAGRRLGAAAKKLEEIFARITDAYETITDPGQRSEYIAYLNRKKKGLSTDVADIHRAEQLFDQATAMIGRRDFVHAKQVLEEAGRLNPDPIYFATLGWVVFSMNPNAPANLSKAVKLLRRAVSEQENLPVAYQYLGSIAYARGNNGEAHKWWQRCLSYEPRNEEAARGLRSLAGRQTKPPPA